MTDEAKPKTTNVRIKSMGGKFATTGVNITAGKGGKLGVDDVCVVPISVADSLDKCDLIERTNTKANCKLVNGVIDRG